MHNSKLLERKLVYHTVSYPNILILVNWSILQNNFMNIYTYYMPIDAKFDADFKNVNFICLSYVFLELLAKTRLF